MDSIQNQSVPGAGTPVGGPASFGGVPQQNQPVPGPAAMPIPVMSSGGTTPVPSAPTAVPSPAPAATPAPSFGRAQPASAPNASGMPPGLGQTDVRTMASDVASIQASGGGGPRPYTPPVAPSGAFDPTKFVPSSPVPPPPPAGGGMKVPSPFPAPPGSPPPFAASAVAASGSAPTPAKKGGAKKGVFALILSIVIVVGVGTAGYFFVGPLIFSSTPAEEVPAPTTPGGPTVPPIELPAVPSAEALPAESLVPTSTVSTETPTSTPPAAAETPATPAAAHISFLKTAADSTASKALSSITSQTIRAALPFKTTAKPALSEIVFADGADDPVLLPVFGKGLLPTLFTDSVSALFEPDFTYVTYADNVGTWPVLVVKIKEGVALADAQTKLKTIETVPATELAGLYLKDPGAGTSWKAGSVSGNAARYISFAQPSSALSYVWMGNYLVISTNYNAALEVVKRAS